MKKSRKDNQFIKKPIFVGGLKAMRALIQKNMQYPEAAKEAKVGGSVLVKYGIDYKGKVMETSVVQGLGYGCDEEAQRLVKLFEFEVPKLPRKLRVAFQKSIRIHFRLPKETAKKVELNQQSMQINYQVTASKKNSIDAEPLSKQNYTYTITTN